MRQILLTAEGYYIGGVSFDSRAEEVEDAEKGINAESAA
jgi:hypothetical protein